MGGRLPVPSVVALESQLADPAIVETWVTANLIDQHAVPSLGRNRGGDIADYDSSSVSRPEEADNLHPDDLKRVFRRHPAGVVVVTGHGPGGPAGSTATSFVSLSSSPRSSVR